MKQIEDCQRSPLDQLAVDFIPIRARGISSPSIDFCCRAYGVPDSDEAIAERLGVRVSTVRAWRDLGARAHTVPVTRR